MLPIAVSTLVLKLVEGATTVLYVVANVTSPTLSRVSANFSTKPIAAAFKGSQEPEACREPERSMTTITLTSLRVAVAAALTLVGAEENHPMKRRGASTDAVTVTDRKFAWTAT